MKKGWLFLTPAEKDKQFCWKACQHKGTNTPCVLDLDKTFAYSYPNETTTNPFLLYFGNERGIVLFRQKVCESLSLLYKFLWEQVMITANSSTLKILQLNLFYGLKSFLCCQYSASWTQDEFGAQHKFFKKETDKEIHVDARILKEVLILTSFEYLFIYMMWSFFWEPRFHHSQLVTNMKWSKNDLWN